MLRFSLFVTSMLVASTSTAGGVSPCPVDTVPIQIVNEISSGPETILSAAKISDSDPHFRVFVTAITEHIAARLAKNKLCIDSADSKKRSLIQFVSWPLVTSGDIPLAPVPSLDARSTGGCRISSPWIDITFGRIPAPWIRGVVRWNQRQLLADQAVLAGARNVPTGLAMPLKHSEFRNFALDYEDSEIRRKPAVKSIDKRIPPDLLWLFSRSMPIVARESFDMPALGAMSIAMEKGAKDYTNLVIALINHCLASDGVDEYYGGITNAADLISLEQYKIERIYWFGTVIKGEIQ